MAPLPKRIKLMSTIESMTKQLKELELELDEIAQYSNNQTDEICQCNSIVPCSHMRLLQNKYTYSITCTQNQQESNITFRIQASIHTFSEFKQFLTETMQVFHNQLHPTPSASTLPFYHNQHTLSNILELNTFNNNNNLIVNLTFRNFKDQAVFFRLLKMDMAPPQYELIRKNSLLQFNDPHYIECKQEMLKIYFHCFNKLNPILIKSYYYPYLMKNTSSLLASSIVTSVTLSSCQHINKSNVRHISETAREETRELLNATLFHHIDLETCLALFHMGIYEIYRLCARLARVYSSLCWRMLQELKPEYIKILEHPNDHSEIELIKAETWKRLYYFALYVEVNLCHVHDIKMDDLQQEAFLFPQRLDCEEETNMSVICMHFTAKLFVSTSKQNLVWFKLATGSLDSISMHTIYQLEMTLYQIWMEIPIPLRIGNGPFEYITLFTSRAAWTNPAVLQLNQMYYIFWLSVQTRIMSIQKHDRIGDRALLIASICSDTLTKLFYYMNQYNPCGIDTHWTALINEVLDILAISAVDEEIRQRAKLNRKIMRQVTESILTHIPCAPFFEISHYELCILYNNKKC